MTDSPSRKFGSNEVIVLIVAGIIVGALGYLAYSRYLAPTQGPDRTNHETMSMPTVNSAKDLNDAAASLDDTSFETDGIADLDSQADKL